MILLAEYRLRALIAGPYLMSMIGVGLDYQICDSHSVERDLRKCQSDESNDC